jgi:exodeoxyribonuclease-3
MVGKSTLPNVKGAAIHDQLLGSDHCPIELEIEI